MDKLEQALSDIIPKSLDGLVQKNRELVEIRLATDVELANIPAGIVVAREKDEISDYRLVAIHAKGAANGSNPFLSVHILGTCRAGHSWSTSAVVGLDLEKGYALTKTGSIYKLKGKPSQDEPGSYDLMCFCALLNQWGLGPFIGVPPFFF